MKNVHAYLAQSFLIVMVSVLGVFGIGLWISVTLYLNDYLHHLRTLSRHPHVPGLQGQSHMGLDALYHFIHAMELDLAIATIVALGTGWLVAHYVSRSFTRPLATLTRGAHAVARGATNVEVAPTSLEELGHLASALNLVAQTFKEAERERRERLEDLAHEIRTPLMALLGYSRSLVGNIPSAMLAPFDTEIDRISRLTDHLPDAAPVASYFYHPTPTAVDALLMPVWDLYLPLLEPRNITPEIDWDISLVFLVDAQAIREALHNLLSNALHHTPEPGTIRLSVVTSAIPGYGVVVVEDSGVGIPEDERVRILERTVRLDAKHPGQGIGLAVVQSIVNAHGGILSIDTSSLGGAALSLTLPLASR